MSFNEEDQLPIIADERQVVLDIGEGHLLALNCEDPSGKSISIVFDDESEIRELIKGLQLALNILEPKY